MIDRDPTAPESRPTKRESDSTIYDPELPAGTPIHLKRPRDFSKTKENPARYVCKGPIHVQYTGGDRRREPFLVPVTVLDHDRRDALVSDGSRVYINEKWLTQTSVERSSGPASFTPLPERPARMVQDGLTDVISQAPYDETYGLDPKTGKHK